MTHLTATTAIIGIAPPCHTRSVHFQLPQFLSFFAILPLLLSITAFLPLPLVSSDSFPSSAASIGCSVTFQDVDSFHPLLAYRTVAVGCPAGCLSSPTRGKVMGSYPYSASSSVCLAAIHCGLVNASLGGAVFVSRFYRHDWSNSSTQTIFPFDSAFGSFSNGVLSGDVDSASFAVTSDGGDFSFVVRGRGELVTQRRTALFPARAGHVHATLPLKTFPSFNLGTPDWWVFRSYHVIIGGFNGTSYLNDVWVAEPSNLTSLQSDIQWRQLPHAPFSPRSDMQTALTEGLEQRPYDKTVVLYVLGGQTGHACGLPELGVCSAEVWSLSISFSLNPRNEIDFWVTNYTWTSIDAPAAVLPFPARCGFSALYFPQGLFTQPIMLVGGALSYNDSSCSTPPRAVSEVWINDGTDGLRDMHNWYRDADAPFTPRCSQQRVDAFEVSASGGVIDLTIYNPETTLQCVAGGLCVSEVSHDPATGDTSLVAVEIFADVWTCTLVAAVDEPSRCRWGWDGLSDHDTHVNDTVATTTLPLPTALASSTGTRSLWALAGPQIGGVTTQSAIDVWLNARASALPDGPFKWTFLLRAVPDYNVTAADLSAQRLGLPMSYIVRDELLNQSSSYYVGSDWLQSSSPWISPPLFSFGLLSTVSPSLTTIHPQRLSMALSRDDSSVFVPMSASSELTQRPLFQFPLPRLDVGYDEWSARMFDTRQGFGIVFSVSEKVISGGRSAGHYSSDWLLQTETRCLSPDDPSFTDLLGPLSFWRLDGASAATGWDVSFPVNERVSVSCRRGYHFEPPLRAVTAILVCGPNGVWLDTEINAARVCQLNAPLNCTDPLTDTGVSSCQPPSPSLWSIEVERVSADNDTFMAVNTNPLTITDMPVSPGSLLRIRGSWFTSPIEVFVGGQPCLSPQLHDVTFPKQCYNLSCTDSQIGYEVCDDFGNTITCSSPALLGLKLPVLLTAGPAGLPVQVNRSRDGISVPTVSSTSPVIKRLSAYIGSSSTTGKVCNSTDPLHLWNCPVSSPYNLSVCFDTLSVYTYELEVHLGASEQPLPCSEQDQGDVSNSPAARCTRCEVWPFFGSQSVRANPKLVRLLSETDAKLSATTCPAGYQSNYTASLLGDTSQLLCAPCPAGTSTRGVTGAADCFPCDVGKYADEPALGSCRDCEPGFFNNATEARHCIQCPVNQYQPEPGASRCLSCGVGKFVVYEDPTSRAAGNCTDCPARASCDSSGQIVAAAASFLLVDQNRETVTSVPCSASACIAGSQLSCERGGTLVLSSSFSSVINCCGAGRYPAYSAAWQQVGALQDSEGVNVLCAMCLPGHSEVHGECIPCDSVQWGRLVGLLLVMLLVVYLVHRFSSQKGDAAVLSITAYFLQQSQLFLSLTLVTALNLDPLGTSTGGGEERSVSPCWCVVPMHDDSLRLLAALIPVPTLFMLLGALALLQRIAAWCLYRTVPAPGSAPPTPLLLVSAYCYSIFFWTPPPTSSSNQKQQSDNEVEDAHNRRQFEQSPVLELAVPLTLYAQEEPRLHLVECEEKDAQAKVTIDWWSVSDLDPTSVPEQRRCTSRLLSALRSSAAHSAVAPPPWVMYQRSILQVLQLSYIGLVLVSLRFFHLREVGQYGWRLINYPGLSTSSATYRWLLPPMICCLVLVSLAPLLLLLFLARQRRRGVMQHVQLMRDNDSSALGALDWQSVLTAQLCSMYKDDCWWMPAIWATRRLLIVGIFVVADEEQRWVWLSFVNSMLLALHMWLQPFHRHRDNLLDTLSLFTLCLQTTLLCLYPLASHQALYNSLVMVPLVTAAAQYAQHGWIRYRRRVPHGPWYALLSICRR